MIRDNIPLYVFAFLFTLTLTVFSGKLIIPILKESAKQPIYTEGPSWHVSKSGTPTMGGLSFFTAITVTLLLFTLYKFIAGYRNEALSLLICTVYASFNAFVGIIDDATKLKHRKNAGLTARAKLILQFTLSALFLIARRVIIGEALALFPFRFISSDIFHLVLSLIILVGITNCANLTDGIDGLASSVAFTVGIVLFAYSYGISDNGSITSLCLAAGALGFLVFNLHPAKIFMGDTGSLFIGALIGALSFELGSPWLSTVSGGVYVIEGVSVILQVAFYKMTKKRLFKMAPLHHHLEKSGWDENKICIAAILVTLVLSLPIILCTR